MKTLLFPLCFFLSLNIFAQNNKFVVLEEFTTAPCGSCPDGTVIGNELVEKHENLIILAHHGGFGIDSMTIDENVELASAYTNAAPTAAINRLMYDDETIFLNQSQMVWSRQRWDSVVTSQLNIPAIVSLDFTQEFDESNRMLSVDIEMMFEEEVDVSLLRTNLVIAEDSVIGIGPGYDQRNFYNGSSSHPMFERGDPIVGYEHRHVVRAMLGGTWGTPWTGSNIIEVGETYTVQYEYIIPEKFNLDLLSIVAWANLYDEKDQSKHFILNANQQKLDQSQQPNPIYEARITAPLKIYPNPTFQYSVIEIELNNNHLLYIEIIDPRGNIIKKTNLKQFRVGPNVISLNLNQLFTAGNYYIAIKDERHNVIAKSMVVKQ